MTDPDDISARLDATHKVANQAWLDWQRASTARDRAVLAARDADPQWTWQKIADRLGLASHQNAVRMAERARGANVYAYRNQQRRQAKKDQPQGETNHEQR